MLPNGWLIGAPKLHFLYAAAWAVLAGLLLPAVAGFDGKPSIAIGAFLLAVILVLAAVVHDRRLMLVDKAITRHGSETRGA